MPRIPGVNHLDAVRALEKAGFQVVRQGKHVVMSDGVRQVTQWKPGRRPPRRLMRDVSLGRAHDS